VNTHVKEFELGDNSLLQVKSPWL